MWKSGKGGLGICKFWKTQSARTNDRGGRNVWSTFGHLDLEPAKEESLNDGVSKGAASKANVNCCFIQVNYRLEGELVLVAKKKDYSGALNVSV